MNKESRVEPLDVGSDGRDLPRTPLPGDPLAAELTNYTAGCTERAFPPWWDRWGRQLEADDRVNGEMLALAGFCAGKATRGDTVSDLHAALAAWVREEMPWPFDDISRHDAEGTDTAWEIAARLLPVIEREFGAIAETARAVKRRTYPPARLAAPSAPQGKETERDIGARRHDGNQ